MAKRVVIGMSGGVDSSVAAYLLKEQGYDVQCIFMKNWEDEDDEFYCSTEEDYSAAVQVCDLLDIPLHSVNFSKEYRENVFKYFLTEYKSGRTPNPDVLCNKEIKFKFFLDYALNLGAEAIATGHYARVIKSADGYQLFKGIDKNKDQSYFLYLLGQKELSKTIFTVGGMTKPEVRELAKKMKMPNSNKKDSTGICFIGERDFKTFLQQYLPARPGDIITAEGELVGQHDGLMYYTLGQRKGIGVGGGYGATEEPWYVVNKDIDKNHLVIGQGHDHPGLYSNNIKAGQLHWITSVPTKIPAECTAKIRYRQKDQICTITAINNGIATITFTEDQFAPTPGQSIVFYDGEQCLGGGIIETV
ncbi:MAG: tRNA 2-thiouridine(34) synthase MnmA [Candidatus Neomarinimicrobiota bacterium]